MTDDSDFDPEEHEQKMGEYLSTRIVRGRIRMSALNERLANEHNIENRSAHHALLTNIVGLPGLIPSMPNLGSKSPSIPRDLTPWETASKQLETVARACEKIIGVADTMDTVVFQALHWELKKKTPHYHLADLFTAVRELREAASEASEIKGQSGRRPHPDWMVEAARMSIEFWKKNRKEKAAPYFRPSKKYSSTKNEETVPSNDFSRWFFDVMRTVDKMATPSMCETLLQHASADPNSIVPAWPGLSTIKKKVRRRRPARAKRHPRKS
jgi:hypothetical protein